MIGKCDSCRKYGVLKTQTNFGVKRNMCSVCCEAADKCERMMHPVDNPTMRVKPEIREKIGRRQDAKSVPTNWLELYAKGELE